MKRKKKWKKRSRADKEFKFLTIGNSYHITVYDATAKIPSGLLNGNVNQLGDFDECVGIEATDGIRGQYCLAYLQLDVDQSRPYLSHLHRLLHSHYAFRSNMSDVSISNFPTGQLELRVLISRQTFNGGR